MMSRGQALAFVAWIGLSLPASAFDCPKTYEAFAQKVLELNTKASELAAKPGSSDLLYEEGEAGEMITLLAPARLDPKAPFIGFAAKCWVYYYDFFKSLEKKSSKEEVKKRDQMLSDWEACINQLYFNKSLGTDIIACHRQLTRASAEDKKSQ